MLREIASHYKPHLVLSATLWANIRYTCTHTHHCGLNYLFVSFFVMHRKKATTFCWFIPKIVAPLQIKSTCRLIPLRISVEVDVDSSVFVWRSFHLRLSELRYQSLPTTTSSETIPSIFQRNVTFRRFCTIQCTLYSGASVIKSST